MLATFVIQLKNSHHSVPYPSFIFLLHILWNRCSGAGNATTESIGIERGELTHLSCDQVPTSSTARSTR